MKLTHPIFLFSFFICAEFYQDSNSEWNNKYKKPEGRYTRDVEDYEIVVPQKVNEDNSFLSYFLPHYHNGGYQESGAKKYNSHSPKKREDKEYKVHYKVGIGGRYHHLELVPNWNLVPQNLILEVRGKRGSNNITNIKMRQITDDHLCHYSGIVRGHSSSQAALSLCDGLVGYIKTDDSKYFIEPLKDEEPAETGEHLHLIYKRGTDPQGSETGSCGTSDDWERAWRERLTREALHHVGSRNSSIITKRSSSRHSFIETLVVADKKFLEYHKGKNAETYILTIMNMVSGYFHDASIGNQIDITIVRIMYLEMEKEEMDLEITTESDKTLESFCNWQVGLNPKLNHPNHHDIAVLLTRHDLCAKENVEGSCGLLGLAYVAAACEPDKACCINEDNGLMLGVTVAHEMGHVMGCSHDDPEVSGCSPESGDGFYNVMSPIVQMSINVWSKCSRKFVTELLDFNLGNCLANEPMEHKFEVDDESLSGAVYDADIQCSWRHGQNVKACNINPDKFCEKLFCKIDANCYTYGQPPSDGTSCGSKKWCYQRKCVEMGSRPDAVNGGWGAWSTESECSRSCGGGVAVSERECDNPKPNRKGRYCLGPRRRYTICNTKKCPSNKPTFRELQCSEKDQVEYKGKFHTWTPYLMSGGKPCELVCLNDENRFTTLEPTVKDGTPCQLGTRNMCIEGRCRKIGCDWELESDAIEDVCGVCNGDGTHCKMVEETFTQPQGNGYVEISTIPAHSTNILIEELAESENTIAISADDRSTFYLNGNNKEEIDGQFNFGKDTIGIYSHSEPQKEELIIRGPITEDLILYIAFYGYENPGVRYKYYAPIGGISHVPNYHWEFVKWEPCSAECGGGTRVSVAKCIEEEAGGVSDSFCSLLPKPEMKQEDCNMDPCPTKWVTGPWQTCSGCEGKTGHQIREVQCMQKLGMGEEEVIVEMSECNGRRPRRRKECTTDDPCRVRRQEKTTASGLPVGTIAVDPIPKDRVTLVKVPIIQNSRNEPAHLSDEAYEELGDQVPVGIDEKNAETFKGEDAAKEEQRMKNKKHCNDPC